MLTCCGVVSLECLHNKDPETIFYCCGVVTDREFQDSNVRRIHHGMLSGLLKCDFELGEEIDENVTKICGPAVPFVQKIPEGLYIGRVVQIDGKVHPHANRFHVNFVTEGSKESNVFFHFNPRFDRRVVVRNYRKKGTWGEEEIAAGRCFPLEPGKGFRLTFYVADGKIMVAVNQTPFCSYSWKMPLELVRYLQIDGDLSLKSVQYMYSMRYPFVYKQNKLQLIAPKTQYGEPIILRKTKLISPGTAIYLSGRVKLHPQNFYINLQEGATIVPHPLVPLHINLRMRQPGHQEQRIILNSWMNGSWGNEVQPECCPFLPGLEFLLTVIYLEDGFHISVNGQFVASFPLRVPCKPWLDTVLAQGDVIITKLKISRFSINTVKNN